MEAVTTRADLVLSVVEPALVERDVILVGHGHFSRAVVARWVHFPTIEGRRFALGPAAHSVLGYEHGFRQILAHNVDSRTPRSGRERTRPEN